MEKDSCNAAIQAAIRQVLAGNVNAYELIYRRFDRNLRAFLAARYSWAGPDFLDEVALRTHEYALSRLAGYDSTKSAFLTWLCWQARSTASRVLAEWYSPRFVRFDAKRHEVRAGTAPGPADLREAERRSRIINEELAALSEAGRLAVTLHDMAQQTFAETAQAAGLSVGRLRRERARALERLRRRLIEQEVSPIEVDSTPAPVFHGWDWTAPDDDWTATTTGRLPAGPDVLPGAAAAELPDEEPPET